MKRRRAYGWGPLLLAGLGLMLVVLLEFIPNSLLRPLLATSASAITAELVQVKLAAWSGVNAIFWLSLATLLAGIGLYLGRNALRRRLPSADITAAVGPERGYHLALAGLRSIAAGQTRLLQHGLSEALPANHCRDRGRCDRVHPVEPLRPEHRGRLVRGKPT